MPAVGRWLVEPDADEVRRGDERRNVPGHVVDAEADPVRTQQVVNRVVEPGRVGELGNVAKAGRQATQEGVESLDVPMPAGREMEEDRAEPAGERLDAVEELRDRVLRVARLLASSCA